ncbi:MAG: hypothetical protein JKY15_07720 [Deltaproteobacteria bacterium]|nr:hypothetical protein [Deltaproteobacteria bacterium]
MKKILLISSLMLGFQAAAETDWGRNNVPRAILAASSATIAGIGAHWSNEARDNHSSTNEHALSAATWGFGFTAGLSGLAALFELVTIGEEEPVKPALFALATAAAVIPFVSSIVAYKHANFREPAANPYSTTPTPPTYEPEYGQTTATTTQAPPPPGKQKREKDLKITFGLGLGILPWTVAALVGAIFIRDLKAEVAAAGIAPAAPQIQMQEQ